MIFNRTSKVFAVAAMAALLAAPAVSQASLLSDWFGETPAYRPMFGGFRTAVVAAPAQTVQYVPQTSYRTVSVNVPMTTFRPMTTCDPCTGCPVTVMRPVTCYVRQCRQVAYTTYRPVVVQRPVCAPACAPACPTGGCGTGASYGAVPSTSIAAPGSPSCCSPSSPGVGTPTYSAPATPVPSYGAPSYTAPPASSPGTTITPQPSLKPESSTAPQQNGTDSSSTEPRTFEEPDADNSDPQTPLQPVPETNGSATRGLFRSPRLLNPQDRTTMQPAPRWGVTQAVHQEPDFSVETDAQGWRPARTR